MMLSCFKHRDGNVFVLREPVYSELGFGRAYEDRRTGLLAPNQMSLLRLQYNLASAMLALRRKRLA